MPKLDKETLARLITNWREYGLYLTKDDLIEIGRDLGVRLSYYKSWDEIFGTLYDAVEYDKLIARLIKEVERQLEIEKNNLEKYPDDAGIRARITRLKKLLDILKAGIIEKIEPAEEIETPGHDAFVKMLVELGEMMGFEARANYRYGLEVYDAIWRRRIPGASPSHVFEVVIKGNLHSALGKLSHAHDLWNSKLILVVDKNLLNKAEDLLSGSYHSIKKSVVIFLTNEVQELYEKKKSIIELEKKLL